MSRLFGLTERVYPTVADALRRDSQKLDNRPVGQFWTSMKLHLVTLPTNKPPGR